MMHAAPWRIADLDGGLERSDGEARIDRAADGVTHDPTGPGIEDRSQVDEAGCDRDIGDVSHPELVGAVQRHVLGQTWKDRINVIAIRRRDEAPAPLWIQRVLAHEAANLLGVRDDAPMAQFGTKTPVAIGLELVANRFHLRNDNRVAYAGSRRVVERGAADPH
jgi:hypothetical protein